MKYTYQPKLSWQESREKDPCCVHVQSLRRLKCKEVMVCGLEKNRLKRLSQSSVCVWLTKSDKTKTVNDLKKMKKLFLLMPQLSSVIAAVPSFNLHFMHTLRFLSSVWVKELLICLYPPAVQQRCLWTESSVISHLPHRFKCNNTVVIMTQTQLLT